MMKDDTLWVLIGHYALCVLCVCAHTYTHQYTYSQHFGHDGCQTEVAGHTVEKFTQHVLISWGQR